MKPVYYYCVAVSHILILPDKHETPQVVHKRTKQRGKKFKRMNRSPEYVS